MTIPEYPHNVQDYLIVQDVIANGVTKRIGLATQLITDRPYATESYQVANYGIGGQYAPHPDAASYYIHPGMRQTVAKNKLKYTLCVVIL